jgi:hypothetical protein
MSTSTISKHLSDEILFEISKFQIGNLKKRIINELVEFQKKDDYISVELEEIISSFKKLELALAVTIFPKEENNMYKFTLTKDYPFSKPLKFTINYINYSDYFKISSPKTSAELKKYYGIDCLCCSSIYCNGNWSPAIKIDDLIKEYKKIKKCRREIIERILAFKIVNKYLVSDINILEWLVKE